MPSIIEEYNYDIFISNRQKDNKGDRWVSEFVGALKTELESTFKEEISVYFDINPHDGLLETHDVDASLKNKLKCLVFIPIISRTYCDPKSFAWEHEFKAFVEQASKDQFGLKVKLPNGNVASRVLPVRIYDLDSSDIKLCESVLGGVLRGVEFIYGESGVNRPLKSDDDEKINLNKTKYRNQINKVANAIKEIITGIEQPFLEKEEVSREFPQQKLYTRENPKTKIITGSIIVFVLIVLGYLFIPKMFQSDNQVEKSIAVLPFKSLSDDPEKQYQADGMMDAILLHLSKINDLRVMSRTSVEQYRGTTKTTRQIGKELDVEYLLEGSFQKFGDNARLIVQLIKANEESHTWGNEYNSKWSEVFLLQSEVAQTIVRELGAAITPEEKQIIEIIPTTSLTAYDFYQRGRDEHNKYWFNNGNRATLEKAIDFYHKALEYDSTFAQAYTGLALAYWDKHYWSEYFSENYMDSVLILSDIALSFDNQLSEAYTIRGVYYSFIGRSEQAIEEFDKAIKFNPNDWLANAQKGYLYLYYIDLVNHINYLQKAASINRGPELTALLGDIAWAYFCAGFLEKSKYYCQEKLKLDSDSSAYYYELAVNEHYLADFNKSIKFGVMGYAIDSTKFGILEVIGENYVRLGKYEESLKYHKKWFEKLKTQGAFSTHTMHRIGYSYWQNGYKEEAEYYFNQQIKYCNSENELKRPMGQALYTYYDLAGVYAFRGEKDQAYKNLRIFNQIQKVPLWMSMLMKTDPLFNSIRNEPEFQQIAKDIEAKYQAEHERVRKWLEENNML